MSKAITNDPERDPALGHELPKGATAGPLAEQQNELDAAIGLAQRGRVNLTPAKAIDMAGRLYAQGRFAQAERVSRQIVAARPALADAHNILGASLAALGQCEEAVNAVRRAIKLEPKAASYRSNLGEILRRNGALDEAADELDKAADLDPRNALALNNLGIVHFERYDYAAAANCYRRALALEPSIAEAHNNLGNALRSMGDHDGALDAYEAALTERAIYPEAYNNLGTLLQQDGRFEEAEHALRKAIEQKPFYADAHNNLAKLLVAQDNEIEALRTLGDALKFAPNNVDTLLLTARIQLQRSSLEAAEQGARFALNQNPGNAEALIVLGQVLHETDRYEEAIVALEQALEREPDNAEGLNFYGVALKSVGRLDEARDAILKALQLNDAMYGAYANLNDLVDFSEGTGAELFNRMEAIFETLEESEAERFTALHFAFAKALDDRGEHERALRHYITGGRLKRAQLSYDESDTHGFFDAIRAAFPKEVFEQRKYEGLVDDRLVFIVGMPRSGSTLVEQILASHPDVHGAGEVKYLARAIGQLRDRFPSLPKFPKMAARLTAPQLEIVARSYQQALCEGAGGARKITDKLLTNYFFVGLINLLFPNAKVIHTRRDPVDTCLSGFTKLFKDDMPHSYELGELGRYYAKYRELMDHWEEVLPQGFLTTVAYEDVVADIEKEARRLIEFLGLGWNSKCVEFHKSDRPVKTASVAQVRRPIYKSSVQRWKKYGDGLQPLIDAVAR
jgi:tetratricopeptide (TPR) repeat protein